MKNRVKIIGNYSKLEIYNSADGVCQISKKPRLRVTIRDYGKAKRDLTYKRMWINIAIYVAIL